MILDCVVFCRLCILYIFSWVEAINSRVESQYHFLVLTRRLFLEWFASNVGF